jgi:hypothetical protein
MTTPKIPEFRRKSKIVTIAEVEVEVSGWQMGVLSDVLEANPKLAAIIDAGESPEPGQLIGAIARSDIGSVLAQGCGFDASAAEAAQAFSHLIIGDQMELIGHILAMTFPKLADGPLAPAIAMLTTGATPS